MSKSIRNQIKKWAKKGFKQSRSPSYLVLSPGPKGWSVTDNIWSSGEHGGGQVLRDNFPSKNEAFTWAESLKNRIIDESNFWSPDDIKIVVDDISAREHYKNWLERNKKKKIIKTENYKKAQNKPWGEEERRREKEQEDSHPELDANPLNGRSNQQSKRIVNKIIPDVKGLFSDQSWEGIKKIWDAFNISRLDWTIIDTRYLQNEKGIPIAKEWKIKIDFINDKGRGTSLYGSVTAHGTGTVEDPLSRYDITAYVS